MILAYAALAFTTAVAAIIARKKIVSLVFPLVTGGLVLLTAALHHETHRGRHAASEDDWADVLRSISSPLRRRKVPPAVVAATRVRAMQAALNQPSIPWADVDQYLRDDAMRREFNFDAEHPQLAGEAKPWPGPFVDGQDLATGWQYGDMVLPAPMGCTPEPPLEPLPPRPCPDVKARLTTYFGDQQAALIDDFVTAATQDVPGPAETASPHPPSGNGAEAATPPAVTSAGPGTTTPPDVDDLDNTGVMAALVLDQLGGLTAAQYVDQLFADAERAR